MPIYKKGFPYKFIFYTAAKFFILRLHMSSNLIFFLPDMLGEKINFQIKRNIFQAVLFFLYPIVLLIESSHLRIFPTWLHQGKEHMKHYVNPSAVMFLQVQCRYLAKVKIPIQLSKTGIQYFSDSR